MITLDSDGQHYPDQIPDLLKPLDQGFDIVIGSRFHRNEDRKRVPKVRGIGIKTITKLTQVASYGNIKTLKVDSELIAKMRYPK